MKFYRFFLQDLSFNNLGAKGIRKLAAAIPNCAQVKTLNIAGQ